jgi:hypothetical protein
VLCVLSGQEGPHEEPLSFIRSVFVVRVGAVLPHLATSHETPALHDGDFRVVGSDSDKLSIHVQGKNVEQAKNIKIQLQRSGTAVDLTLSHVPKKELQLTIEIPKSTSLYTRMHGGDLSVQDVVKDKDLELTGGDLTIQVGSPEDYSHVDLSVKFGDISGTQFGDPKGGIGNSLRKHGNGKYKLHAHVMAGDLVLKS